MKLRIIFSALSVAALLSTMQAMSIYDKDIWDAMPHMNLNDANKLLEECIPADAQHRGDRLKVLNVKEYLLQGCEEFWTDGQYLYNTMQEDDDKTIIMSYTKPLITQNENLREKPVTMILSGKKVKTKGKTPLKVTVEKLGNYTMLVMRNAQGSPIKAYYYITNEMRNIDTWAIFVHYILAGNYATTDGHNAIFGRKMPFYNLSHSYDQDPGIYNYYIHPEDNTIDIIYAEGRVSHGDPSSPNYGKMPGGGGAAALMPPMTWNVKFTTEGVFVKVVDDQKFVDHSPAIPDGKSMLTKLQCPWEGIDGKWSFASVIPLSHGLLQLFPADALELMRAEIYARHGDKFTKPATQRYFDAQPWYHKSSKPIVLTDIERFNVAMIKQVMATKK